MFRLPTSTSFTVIHLRTSVPRLDFAMILRLSPIPLQWSWLGLVGRTVEGRSHSDPTSGWWFYRPMPAVKMARLNPRQYATNHGMDGRLEVQPGATREAITAAYNRSRSGKRRFGPIPISGAKAGFSGVSEEPWPWPHEPSTQCVGCLMKYLYSHQMMTQFVAQPKKWFWQIRVSKTFKPHSIARKAVEAPTTQAKR